MRQIPSGVLAQTKIDYKRKITIYFQKETAVYQEKKRKEKENPHDGKRELKLIFIFSYIYYGGESWVGRWKRSVVGMARASGGDVRAAA